MTVKGTPPVVLKRQFPHVDDVEDWRAQQTIRLLWDRVFNLEERVQAHEATLGDLVSAANAQEDDLRLAQAKADEALAVAQLLEAERKRLEEEEEEGEGGGPGGDAWLWDWDDLEEGGPAPVAPGSPSGAPSTMAEWQAYFFSIIDRTIGTPAPDWREVSLQLVADGMHQNPVPEPSPDAEPDPSWPFFGISMMIDGSGEPRGRIFLPTAVVDGAGYYTRDIQYIRDYDTGAEAAAGCGEAGANGDIGATEQTARNAGKIVCGTGAEFPALRAPVATIDIRNANAEQLVKRMIWHLKDQGFTAGRQQNPSGALSVDKLCVIVDGFLRAYDVFGAKNEFTVEMTTHMNEVTPPVLVDDPGIPD